MRIKRLLSLLLALCLLLSAVPMSARAENGPDTSVDTGDISIEGTNGFGTLLSEEIARHQSDAAQGDFPGGYTVTGLEISGSQATVTYDAMEEARLVVALYTEDGVQLLTSATVTVSPEETQALVAFEGEMPQSFMASAYLLDSYDHSPLCASYDTPMHTREMQELLASTVDDYDPDRVLNLDSDKTTNFAVYAEDTIVIDYVPGTNTVSGVDDESRTYVIENADSRITGLQPGDVFAYPYGVNEFLIVKVGSIQVDGTTATITGADLEMEEVFSHVKMDGTTDSEDMVVTDLDPNDGITYEGSSAPAPRSGISTMAWEDEGEIAEVVHTLGFDETFKNSDGNREVNVRGGLEFRVSASFKYFLSWKRVFLEFKIDLNLGVSLHISGEIKKELHSFAEFSIGPFWGVTISCEPTLMLEFGGEFWFEAVVTVTPGFSFSTDNGLTNISTSPRVDPEVELEGTFFFGVDLKPSVNIISKHVAEAELSIPIGVNVEAKFTGTDYDAPALGVADQGESIHSCGKCLDISVSPQLQLKVKLKFFNWDALGKQDEFTFAPFRFNFYWSFTNSVAGAGKCPYNTFRTTIHLTTPDGKPAADIAVTVTDNQSGKSTVTGLSDENGVVIDYYPEGSYTIEATVSGVALRTVVNISYACKVELNEDTAGPLIAKIHTPSEPMIDGTPKASGTCGRNLTWKLYSNGLLVISGTGPMYDYTWAEYPWRSYRGSIIRAVVMDGVTTIGKSAFWECGDMTSVYIGQDVKSIGEGAFGYCDELTQVTIPDSVTHIGARAFLSCDRLKEVMIPNGVIHIGDEAFGYCDRMTYVSIPESITTIGVETFQFCFNLTSVTIPDSVTTISDWAFYQCVNLSEVTIGSGVSTIGEGAFEYCESLKEVYYVGNEAQWQRISIGKRNEALKKGSIHYNSTGPASADLLNPTTSSIQRPGGSVDDRNPDSVYGGEYGSETTGEYTLKTAAFTGLVPGAEYVLLALADIEAADLLAPENLLFIDQAAAGEDGTLSFRYAQRVPMDVSYVIACGPSNKNLADAVITFPEMTAGGTTKVVNPTVVYDRKTLTEGVDYVITGTVDYNQPGTYTCYIRGIRNYTGLVECQYTVTEEPEQPEKDEVIRLAGSHRWETALKVADEMKANLDIEKFDAIIIASGNDFADALAGSYLSTVKNAPILLGWGKGGKYVTLDEANIAYIKANLAEGGTVYILGGKNAVPELDENELKGYNVKRLGGANRFETNLLILAEAGVADGSEILVCTSTNFADSLSASATAKPILLVFNEYGKLYGKQPEFLSNLKNCTFTVIGGESAVSADLAKAIETYGKVERLAGANRFETSVMVAQKYFKDVDTAVLAYAWNYPDGLCGGSLAYSLKAPLILTMTKYEAKAVEYAKAAGITTGLVLGGETLISDEAVRAIFAMDAADEIIKK